MFANPSGDDDSSDNDTKQRGPDTQPIRKIATGERQRAAIALGVLAIVALVLVGIMVAVLGSDSNGSDNRRIVGNPTGPPVVVSGHNTGSTQPSQKSSSAPPRRTHSPGPPRNRKVSCPTDSPCTLPDDIGNALGALNAYRTSHGKAPVTGKVTQAATTCAINEGNNCSGGYFWEPVGRSGHEVITKIAAKSDGDSWLLDDNMKSVQIGWAYLPSSQSFECALISNG